MSAAVRRGISSVASIPGFWSTRQTAREARNSFNGMGLMGWAGGWLRMDWSLGPGLAFVCRFAGPRLMSEGLKSCRSRDSLGPRGAPAGPEASLP